MATWYWVGGTGTFSNTITTNWASSSGGAGGAGHPVAGDTAIFDSHSGTGTVTWSNGVTSSLLCDGTGAGSVGSYSGTINATSSIHTLAGSLHLSSTMGWNGGGLQFVFSATTTGQTISLYGNTLTTGTVTINGVGGGWTLGSSGSFGGLFTITNGAFSDGGVAWSCVELSCTGSAARSLTVSGTLTLTGTGVIWTTAVITNLTLTLTSSTIIVGDNTATAKTITLNSAGAAATFNNIDIGGGSSGAVVSPVAFTGTIAATIAGTLSSSATGPFAVTFPANYSIGTISMSGNSSAMSTFGSSVAGTQRTLNLSNASTMSYTYVKDIKIGGANLSGAFLFNTGNNTTGAGGSFTWGNGSPVQIITGSGNATSVATTAFPASNAVGNTILVTAVGGNTLTSLTVTDTQGNTYTPLPGGFSFAANTYRSTWIARSIKAGANTVTLTALGASPLFVAFVAAEITGIYTTSNPVDQIAQAFNFGITGATVATTNTTTSSPELAVMLGGAGAGSTTLTSGAGWLFYNQAQGTDIFVGQAFMAFQLLLSETAVVGIISQSGSTDIALWTDTLFLSGYTPPVSSGNFVTMLSR